LAGDGVDEAEVGLFVGTIQADDQVIGVRCSWVLWVECFLVSRRLDPATPI
jgi:hypothetical protein